MTKKVVFLIFIFLILIEKNFAFDFTDHQCTDKTQTIDANSAVIWHHLVCSALYGQKLTINLLDIDLNNSAIKIQPIKTSESLSNLSTIATKNPQVIAGINGGYFYNAKNNSQYKDPTCPTKSYPQTGDLGDSLLQIDNQVLSMNCDFNGDGKSHLSRTAIVIDENEHVYFQPVSPNQPLKNLQYTNQPNVAYALSAGPNLISMSKGKGFINITEEGFDHLERKAPRTAAGVTSNNHLLLLTIDGKSPYLGVTIRELAQFMLNDLKAVSAMNLDGGGSTTMCIKLADNHSNLCTIVNQPSDADGPRNIHDGLFVIAR